MQHRKIIFMAFSLLFIHIFSYGEELKSVQQMGDIWIVTIDKSGSMLYGTSAHSLAANVSTRLRNGHFLTDVDFDKDRFLFFTSGFSYSSNIGLGNELLHSAGFDQSFIHSTDDSLYVFHGKEELVEHIRGLLAKNDYCHQLSFVSQIRLFSIIRAVNFLKAKGHSDGFNEISLLTITDDADQNDQWMMDYRNLKKWAPCKVKEVNDSTTKYLYNSLNGKGQGSLNESFADEHEIPHIWVYHYVSIQQCVVERFIDVLKLDAANGGTISLSLKDDCVDGGRIQFVHIDSIKVNSMCFSVDSSFVESCIISRNYDNKLKTNKITLSGYAQVEYEDSIYGHHFKLLPFTQSDVIVSQKLMTLLSFSTAFIITIIIGLFLFVLLIRPNTIICSIHSTLGKKSVLKRGFKTDWEGESIPVHCYQENDSELFGVIIRKHKNIKSYDNGINVPEKAEVLIHSKYPIYLSTDAVRHSTEDDIENIYNSRTGDYSPLMRELYEKTTIYKLRKQYVRANYKWQQYSLKLLMNFYNIVNKHYYYIIKDITRHDRICFSCDSLIVGKLFVIENHKVAGECNYSQCKNTVERVLTHYYLTSTRENDLILTNDVIYNDVYWTVFIINDWHVPDNSLRTVKCLVRFKEENGFDDYISTAKLIIKALKREIPHKSIEFIDTTYIQGGLKFSFSTILPSAPGFISFIESTPHPRHQLLYSPIKDGCITEKLIQLKRNYKNGYLYYSPIPVKYAVSRDSLNKLLSSVVVNGGSKQPSILSFNGDCLEFRDIHVTF